VSAQVGKAKRVREKRAGMMGKSSIIRTATNGSQRGSIMRGKDRSMAVRFWYQLQRERNTKDSMIVVILPFHVQRFQTEHNLVYSAGEDFISSTRRRIQPLRLTSSVKEPHSHCLP
jgi:hypothetical protein